MLLAVATGMAPQSGGVEQLTQMAISKAIWIGVGLFIVVGGLKRYLGHKRPEVDEQAAAGTKPVAMRVFGAVMGEPQATTKDEASSEVAVVPTEYGRFRYDPDAIYEDETAT